MKALAEFLREAPLPLHILLLPFWALAFLIAGICDLWVEFWR